VLGDLKKDSNPVKHDTAYCRMCAEVIQFDGQHWYHVHSTPRHPAEPSNMTDKEKSETEVQFEILNDGMMIPVRFAGGSGEEVVKVRKMGYAEMPLLASIMNDEVKLISTVTGKDKAWIENLEDDSFHTLVKEGRRLNFPRFGKYWERQKELLKAMGQGDAIQEAVEKAMAKAVDQSA
jgi:hypothetical protein